MKTPTVKFYRPELDGIRFFAFFLVFLQHLTVPNGHARVTTWTGLIFNLHLCGWIGVDLFLCLSSYLITKLLFLEWKSKGTISVKAFYIRRILRIWPLYFLACLLGFLVFPAFGLFGISFGNTAYQTLIHGFLWPYLLLAGNWATAWQGYPAVDFLAPLWTISLEEQFYFVGPLLLVFCRFEKKAILRLAGFLLVLTFAARFGFVWMGVKFPAIWVCTLTRLDPFVLGTCLAMFEDEIILFSKRVPAAVFGAVGVTLLGLVLVFTDVEQPDMSAIWQYFFMDLGFCCLIFSITQLESLKRFFSFRPFVRLGKISYGLYVYHTLAYSLTGWVLYWMIEHRSLNTFIGYEALNLIMGLAITVSLALVSYYCFEKVFLKLKRRFTAIESRPV